VQFFADGEPMGINSADLAVLVNLRKKGHFEVPRAVMEIGAQQLSADVFDGEHLAEVGDLFGADVNLISNLGSAKGTRAELSPEAPLARHFWEWLGFSYASIDIDGSPGSIPLDLNYDDVPEGSRGKFPLVTNFGTTEHVANQLNAFKVIHDLVAPGGIMIHNLPAQGHSNHGLVNYNLKFFWMLARSNDYDWLNLDYTISGELQTLREDIVEDVVRFTPGFAEVGSRATIRDHSLIVVLQKKWDWDYVAPLDAARGKAPNEALEKRYWTVFGSEPPQPAAPSPRPDGGGMKIFSAFRELAVSPRMLSNINEGIKNQSTLLNDKLIEIKAAIEQADRKGTTLLTRMNENVVKQRDVLTAIKSAIGRAEPESVLIQKRSIEYPASVELDHDADLPFPAVDISKRDPISAITATAEFQRCAEIIKSRGLGDISLMSEHSQALLYCTIRLVRPKLVIEIGTYRAGTAKVIAWALAANGSGMLHTVDPFGKSRVPSILASWPAHLRDIVSFYPVNSMEYFGSLAETGERSGLIFVDGNHDYEFALFDIESAARVAAPNGFIFIDNTSQAGPFLAAQDFVKHHSSWTECGGNSLDYPIINAPFEQRSPIYATDFCVLRGPATTTITSCPYTPGQLRWDHPSLEGIRIHVADGPPGKLHVQCIVRTFRNETALGEYQIGRSIELQHAGEITVELAFVQDEKPDTQVNYTLIEPWFVWMGKEPLTVDNWALI
jgi:predicted O-methyltransferase YrrM/SAM-dependent methyltransferase